MSPSVSQSPIGRKNLVTVAPFSATVSTIAAMPTPHVLRASRWYVVVGLVFFLGLVTAMCFDVSDEIAKKNLEQYTGVLIFNYVFLCSLSAFVFIVFTRLCRSVSMSAHIRAAVIGGTIAFLLNLSVRNILKHATDRLIVFHDLVSLYTYITLLAISQECLKLFAVIAVTRIASIRRPKQFAVVAAAVGFGFSILEHTEIFKKDIFQEKRIVQGVIRCLMCVHPILTSLAVARTSYPHFVLHTAGIVTRDIFEGLVLPSVFHSALQVSNQVREAHLLYGSAALTVTYIFTVFSLIGNVKALKI